METIRVKAKAIKEIFHNGDFYIIAFSPLQVYDNLKLSQYMTFTCKGSLSFITIGKDYELEIQELSTDRYGTSYKIVSCPTIDKLDFKNLSREESFEILMDCTSSERIANNILDAYENFIEIILTDGKEAIDVSKIHGVGDTYLSAYSRNLLNKYKYYALLKKYSCYEINNNDCKSLYEEFKEDNRIEKEMEKEPYKCLIDICKKSFERVDSLIIKNKPELENSEQRCSYFLLFILQKNELLGHTKINANLLYNYIIKNYAESEVLKDLIVPVVKNSELFFYNEETKEVAKMDTYIAESKIANFVKEKIKNSTKLNIDWTKYKEIKDGELTPEQSNILKEFCENNFIIVNSRGGTGKAQPNDTIIPTPNGNKFLGDLKIGDYVFDRFGNPTKVIGVYPQGLKDNYKVTLSDGRFTYCNNEHLWTYFDSHGKLKTETLKKMMTRTLKFNNNSGYRYKIPTNLQINYEEKNLPINPYVLGCFIGNGCCREQGLTISSNDEENVMRIASLLNASYKKNSQYNYNWTFYKDNKRLLTKDVVPVLYNKYANEKEIPVEYLESSIEQRMELLRGLMDTDGCAVKSKDGIRFKISYSTTSEKLKNNFVSLVFSLGMKASVYEDKRKENICYTINILCNNTKKEDLFHLSRKKEIAREAKNIKINRKYDRIEIINIEKMKSKKEMTCIMVDNDEHLYLTNDYIVTHNTSALMALIKLLEDNNLSYTLLSPTGKVAKRIKEQTNRSAQTIHKACLSSPNGLYSDVFVIEEGSMIGIDLICMLINSIQNPNARIVVNMDLGQIAPISCGCPMRDIINSGLVKVCNLTKVFRYGEGGLYKMATDAYDKKFYIAELDYQNKDRISIGKNKDYTYVRYNGKVEQVIEEYKKLLNRKIKPSDIAVITCWNVTDFGTINLNNKIQEIVNPNNNEKIIEKTIRKIPVKFKIGDLILNTNNNYNVMTLETYKAIKENSILSKEDLENTSIMNGENGKILDIDNGNIIAQFDEDIVVLDKLMQNDLLLGYCITSYKIQGSEAPYTITLITPQFESSLNKNIIYTDMSRARKEVVEIIDPNTLLNTICIDATEERETNLLMLLLDNSQ